MLYDLGASLEIVSELDPLERESESWGERYDALDCSEAGLVLLSRDLPRRLDLRESSVDGCSDTELQSRDELELHD